jgi:hypothetical protein
MADRIAAWGQALGELIAHGRAMSDAVLAGDLVGALTASHEARGVRGRLAGIQPQAPTTPAEITALAEARALVAPARVAERIVDRWRARSLPPDAELAATPVGAAVLADALLPPAWERDADLVVLVGPGWGMVTEILAALGQRRTVVIDGEPCPGAIHVAADDELASAVRTMDPVPPQRFVVRGLGDVARARLGAIAEQVGSVLADRRVHCNTVNAFSSRWIAQGAINLAEVARWPSIGAVGDRLAGVPMIIAAPGPSLAKNVAQLRAAKGRALVAAMSHSLRPLVAAGVEPDLVFTVDPQDVRYHFEGIDVSRMTLVSGVTVHPSLYHLGAARVLTLAANSALDDWIYEGLGEDARAAGGGSVATTALTVALRWKCDPILFVGLDLSFPGGQYYVDTSCDGGARAVVGKDGTMAVEGWSDRFHEMKRAGGSRTVRERTVELPGWHGGTVPSSFMFSMFHRWFVETAQRARATARILNCTEGGAFIDGMDHVTLKEALTPLVHPVDAAAILDEVVASIDAPGRVAAVRARLAGLVATTRRAHDRARRAIALAEAAASDAAAERALRRLEQELIADLRDLGFVSMMAQREIGAAMTTASRVLDPAEALVASGSLFEAVARVTEQVAPMLAEALGGDGAP